MRRITLLIFFSVLTIMPVLAGGIVTNTNQSAAYVRMLARDASTDLDAVFYNPAALALLPEGFFVSINNQSIWQTQTVTNSYSYLNDDTYVGEISAPLFPGIYAAYKTGRFAFSVGFNPVGGGGGAIYNTGLPSFEINVANLVPGLASMGITSYSADIYFEGTSVFWGLQAGISFELNDYISLYGGGRYLMAKNTYNGYIKDMTVYSADLQGGKLATVFLTELGDQATGGATQLYGAASQLQPIIDGNLGSLTLQQAQDAGIIDAATHQMLAGALTSIGVDPTMVDIASSQGAFNMAADGYAAAAADAYANAEATKDVEVDAKQDGTGFTPIIGAHFNLFDKKLNIGIKYEFATPLELKNSTVIDGSGLFPDGGITNNDMPGFLSIGASYQATEKLSLAGGYHKYFDTQVNWDGREEFISKDFIEVAFGLEYAVAENLVVSAGYLYAVTGATDEYETDMSFSLNAHSLAFGGKFAVNENFDINLGVMFVSYFENEKLIRTGGSYMMNANETYDKSNVMFAIGADLKIF